MHTDTVCSLPLCSCLDYSKCCLVYFPSHRCILWHHVYLRPTPILSILYVTYCYRSEYIHYCMYVLMVCFPPDLESFLFFACHLMRQHRKERRPSMDETCQLKWSLLNTATVEAVCYAIMLKDDALKKTVSGMTFVKCKFYFSLHVAVHQTVASVFLCPFMAYSLHRCPVGVWCHLWRVGSDPWQIKVHPVRFTRCQDDHKMTWTLDQSRRLQFNLVWWYLESWNILRESWRYPVFRVTQLVVVLQNWPSAALPCGRCWLEPLVVPSTLTHLLIFIPQKLQIRDLLICWNPAPPSRQ